MPDRKHHCGPHDHVEPGSGAAPHPAAIDRAARLFRAMGDGPRLRILHHLLGGECCVSEIVAASGEKFSTVSQRMRVLRSEGLVARRRDGSHVYYALSDRHVIGLVSNALAHAGELEGLSPSGASSPDHSQEEQVMAHTHANHDHPHGAGCGHTGIQHGDHVDYLHDGHLHHVGAGGAVEEHAVAVSAANPAGCTPGHACDGHASGHVHGPGCGHEVVPHGDHTDYLVDGHLHHPHGDHCDDHGPVTVVK